MSESADSVVSVNLQGKECSKPVVLHLMPCEIDASGVSKAKVNCYFTSTMKEDSPNGKCYNAYSDHGVIVVLLMSCML